MAKLGTTNIGGGGGVGSDELTVTAGKVVEGYTYVGADTDDEIGDGEIPNKGASTASQGVTTSGSNLVTRIPSGAYITNASSGYPEITSSLSSVASVGGLTAEKLLSGQTALGISGTATSDGTITSNTVLSGYAGYSKGVKIVGNVAVQSILSFSAAVYSSAAIAFTWQNPAKGPFSGVIIVGKTGGYPTSITDGTRYYKGSGSNVAASGTSSTTVSSFTGGTTYYFRAFSYAIKDNTEWIHATTYTATAATTKGQQTFTSSGTFTVPANVRSVDIFVVGGGGGGGSGDPGERGGGGGGGGYTKTVKSYSVNPGQTFPITVGAGGLAMSTNRTSGSSSFGSIVTASGGYTGSYGGDPGNGFGGSGGSSGGRGSYSGGGAGGIGGSNGGNGGGNTSGGQGTTTKAFEESSNTLYSGGGGGGSYDNITDYNNGGSGGGGRGGNTYYGNAVAGTANTGGGGGGGAPHISGTLSDGYDGGSGIVIVRWGY